ncbi:MAG: VIT domain-containing protein, partial [Verrucomicrobiota bacterium]
MNAMNMVFGLRPVGGELITASRTILPLKSVRYGFVTRGGMAEVEMIQIYHQEHSKALDCQYVFPLPADGAVYLCEASINGRVIRARIEERKAARELVEKHKAEGRRTVLVESERDNLFTLELGNIQPMDVVEVKLGYLQPLRRITGAVTLDLPLCPGVRYIPGKRLLRSNRGKGIVDDTDRVPDASRISPPRIDSGHPDAAFIDLHGQVEDGMIDGEITSPSHGIKVARMAGMLNITLAAGGDVPDRDLALRWRERESAGTTLRGWVSKDPSGTHALLELRAPASLDASDAVAQDVYFLADRSGSMQGEKWTKVIHALHECVRVLGPGDRAAVTLFESSYLDFDSAPAAPGVMLADPRFLAIGGLGTAGGTELEPAMRHVLELARKHSRSRCAVLIVITDGQIGNESEILNLMREHPAIPVHCFGIDTVLNDGLLLDMVRQQGGTFQALHPGEDVAAVVTHLGRTIRQPALVNLKVPAGWEASNAVIPNLYAGQVQMVSLRAKEHDGANKLILTATDHHNNPTTLEFDLTHVQEVAPRLRWCKEKLVSLVALQDESAAVMLSKASNLVCPLTAFVAWDEQEQVTRAQDRIVQPALFLAEHPAAAYCLRGQAQNLMWELHRSPRPRLKNLIGFFDTDEELSRRPADAIKGKVFAQISEIEAG